MKAPERIMQGVVKTCYIWEKNENTFNLIHVSSSKNSCVKTISDIIGKKISQGSFHKKVDAMIYFENRYIVTTTLRYQSKEMVKIKSIIKEYSNPTTGNRLINDVSLRIESELDYVVN